MTTKTKLTVLSLVVAILATSFVTVFADSEETKTAFENDDYDTVAERYENHTGEKLTEEQFEIMQEAHELMQEGDMEGAKAMLEEAGLEFPKVHKFNLTDEQKEALEQAKELRESGDFEGAKELLEEAEIPLPPKKFRSKNCKCECEFEAKDIE